MDFLIEMEKTEEILKLKWNEIIASKCKAKDIIQQLFILLKDRQSITSAAFQALDTYDVLKQERDELGRRDKVLFREFMCWLNSDREGEEHIAEELEAVMELYGQVVKLTRQILMEWKVCKKTDQKVGLELENLNTKLTGFTNRLEHSNVLDLENFRWPKKQSKKVSKAVEFSFEQMDYIRELMKLLNDKHEILQSIFKDRQEKLRHRPNSNNYASNSKGSGPTSSTSSRF